MLWATYTRVSVSEFRDIVWGIVSTEKMNYVSAASYFAPVAEPTYFVVREAGEIPTGYGHTFYMFMEIRRKLLFFRNK